MMFKEIKQKLLRFLGNHFLHGVVNVLCKSVKIKFENSKQIDQLINSGENVVFAFWHGTMLIPWYLQRNNNFAALVSQSKDGDLLANILTKWNYNVARGSSHKGGKEAMEILLQKADSGFSVSITPDGPTGPPRNMKAGAVIIAQRSSIQLVLCGIGYQHRYILNSWDKFEIPKFFSRINVIYSDPIYIDNDLEREQVSKIIDDCGEKLNQLQTRAEIFD
ncbi:MAG: lysophospholipid acyltransferase family protein [Bacteroidota bacterium]